MATKRNHVNKRFRKARFKRKVKLFALKQLELIKNWVVMICTITILTFLFTFCYKYFVLNEDIFPAPTVSADLVSFEQTASYPVVEQVQVLSYPTAVEISQEVTTLEPKVEYVHPANDIVYQEMLGKEVCDLTFWSNKSGGYYMTPPAWYIDQLVSEGFNCNSQKWLSRLAHYESEFNPNVCNTIYCGLYQIGPDARDMCINNGRNKSDHDCADYLKDWLDEMPLMFESHYRNENSFLDL